MKVMIDIPKESFNAIKNGCFAFDDDINDLFHWIANGTLLPKGHGRLIDADKLVPDCQEDFVHYDDDEHNVFTAVGIAQIECADTIIEADKAESEEMK